MLRGDLAIRLEIEDEVLRILHDKFGRNPQMMQRRLGTLWKEAVRGKVTGEMEEACRDSKDDCIVECALKARMA